MPADLEERLRHALRPGDPPAGSEARMLNRLVAAPAGRGPAHRKRSGAFAAAAMIAIAAVALVLMVPRGHRRDAPTPPAAFSVLAGGTPADLSALGVGVEDLRFPGLEPATLRLVRTVGDTAVLAGMNRDGLVCLALIGPEPGPPPKAQPGQAVATHTRAFTQCGLPAAVERSALVQITWVGRARPVLLVADGVRLRTGDGPVPVAGNIAVLEPGTESVTATFPDGTTRRLRIDERTFMPLAAADRAAIRAVPVPDLAGVDADEAGRLLDATLLASGATTAEPSQDVPPGHVLRQSPAPGTSVDPGSSVDMVLTSPGGRRDDVPAETALLLDALGSRPGSPVFRATTLGALRGMPRVLVFARDRREAASARWVPQAGLFSGGSIVVVSGDRASAAAVGNGATSAGLAADPDGTLAAVLGVRAPATVVLDREGRVAVRSATLPAGPEPDPALDLEAIISTLLLEPRAAGASAPEPPASAWWLTSRAPLSAAAVSAVLPASLPCAADRDRVWAFGPAGGHRMWIALAHGVTPDGSLGQAVIVAPEGAGSRATVSVIGCGAFPAGAAGRPAVPVWTGASGGVRLRVLVVRGGYERAEVGGRTHPVENGMLVLEGNDLPDDDRIILVGPAGRTPLA